MTGLVACACVASLAAQTRRPPGTAGGITPDQHFPVRFAFDGDTLDVTGAGRVRLLGIDAPEMGAGFDTPAPFAREARTHLIAVAVGRWVHLETDAETRDTYGRLLAYVIRDDGLFVNAAMVREGLARVTARRQLRRLAELRKAEAEAQRARRGMWGARPAIRPILNKN
jgi:micrococcal nuclease